MNLEVRTPEEQAQSATFRGRAGGLALSVIGVVLAAGGAEKIAEGRIKEGIAVVVGGAAVTLEGVILADFSRLERVATGISASIRHHLSDHPDSARSTVTNFLEEAEAAGRPSAD